ncbi:MULTISPECIES: extracellular solute-binding protein [unclassified Streptomyces]|uniref:ABC transporter substrate-binding protein n=1 Tax=unclassified Streptomyces TaxID=2593676 RepID=UPI002DD8484D|nr:MULTISPECIES: extracellular solute-binding protein [unclassified Streptomyces]WSA94657.1 extracellular solute-binding protein [Streptomyces sp. NBC_01795]WSB79076.1 extracellular solute-binding protein [Streptomyces sp. NBC_01775]WSS12723.1 extracellular solute-binding protein [Streptomyces sp. NBC_01186]WSS41506.1 extracellular solute-binding protein [Streptomyces sp. NBC_01187]
MPSARISRRGLLSLAAASATAASGSALLSACGSGAASGGKVVPFYTTESDPKSLAFYRSVIEKFERGHPGVTVKMTLYSDENQLQYLQSAMQTGTDIGVFAPPAANILDWAVKGYLLPLTGMIEEIGEDDFLPGTRIVDRGEDYAMPFQANASVLYYRKDLLDKAGIDPPRTYGQFLGAVRELHGRDGIDGISSGAGNTPGMTTQFLAPYVYQSGWDYYGPDGEVLFGKDEVLDAVKRHVAIMRYGRKGAYNTNYPDLMNTYISGKAAFATMAGRLGVNLAAQNPKIAEVTGVLPVPAGPFRTGRLAYGGKNQYSVFAHTRHRREARAFLKELTTGENALKFSLTVPGHLVPPLKSVKARLREEIGVSDDPYLKKHGGWVRTIVDLVPDAMSPDMAMGSVVNKRYDGKRSNPCPWAGKAWAPPPADASMVQSILLRGDDPEQAWRRAVDQFAFAARDWKSANPEWRPAA